MTSEPGPDSEPGFGRGLSQLAGQSWWVSLAYGTAGQAQRCDQECRLPSLPLFSRRRRGGCWSWCRSRAFQRSAWSGSLCCPCLRNRLRDQRVAVAPGRTRRTVGHPQRSQGVVSPKRTGNHHGHAERQRVERCLGAAGRFRSATGARPTGFAAGRRDTKGVEDSGLWQPHPVDRFSTPTWLVATTFFLGPYATSSEHLGPSLVPHLSRSVPRRWCEVHPAVGCPKLALASAPRPLTTSNRRRSSSGACQDSARIWHQPAAAMWALE